MPVPRLGPAPIPVTPEPVRKAGKVISHLLKLGYDLEDERDAVKIIENNNLDRSECEVLVLDVVNDKVLNNTYFVKSDKPFTSLSDVETTFDEVYDKSFETKRVYYVESRNTNDPVKKFMQSHSDAKDAYLLATTPLS